MIIQYNLYIYNYIYIVIHKINIQNKNIIG